LLQTGRRPQPIAPRNEIFMSHKIYRVKSFAIVASHTLNVDFDDGSSRRIDFRPALIGEIDAPLRDLKLFEQVSLDREVHTLAWPNGADFDPATLHDWPEKAEEVAAAVADWNSGREAEA
jgi:hypothetical protein